MTIVKFKFDKEKDLWNNWHRCNRKTNWSISKVDSGIKEICEGKSFEESKGELNRKLSTLQKSYLIKLDLKFLEKAWSKIEKEFFRRMNKLMKNKYHRKITSYLTTAGGCPYDPDEPSFMVSLWYSLPHQLSTCGHEIMHLYFHEFYWEKVEKEIEYDKTADLKEAFTVLLNEEFKDLWFSYDQGYEPHKELRNFIIKSWKKKKDFDKLIDDCIKWIKKNGIK